MRPSFPRNCWYVAATSDELDGELVGRRILDQPIVLYRRQSGDVVALEDRCAHRAFPLSRGRLDGDHLVCGYHGFTYDPEGRCVRVPSQPSVSDRVCVATFLVREEPPFVWIWLGDPRAAALNDPPRLPWLTDEGWATFGATLHVAANYMLVHEHHLDLSSVALIHPGTMPAELGQLPPINDVEVSETSVAYSRSLPPAALADWEAEATGLPRDGVYQRRESGTFVSPALHIERWEIDGGDGTVYRNVRVLAITPETPVSTHVFLRGSHDYAVDRAVVTEHLRRLLVDGHATRDQAVLETIQSQFGHEAWSAGARVKADVAALRARRIVTEMLAHETGRSTDAPTPD